MMKATYVAFKIFQNLSCTDREMAPNAAEQTKFLFCVACLHKSNHKLYHYLLLIILQNDTARDSQLELIG